MLTIDIKQTPGEGYLLSCSPDDYGHYAADLLRPKGLNDFRYDDFDERLECFLSGDSPSSDAIQQAVQQMTDLMNDAVAAWAKEHKLPSLPSGASTPAPEPSFP